VNLTGRPRAAVSAAAIWACVMASGPVRVYVAPSWPASVSTMARTGAPRSASASTMARPVFPVVRQEVKETALRQLAEAGPGGLSISAIGKQLGVSGPALYRYFASRDDLLTELVIDAYHDLADALAVAASHVPDDNPRNRFEALARAYRRWARAEPHRYRLLFGQTSSSGSS
jgi:AcrR family transcriptional regulator